MRCGFCSLWTFACNSEFSQNHEIDFWCFWDISRNVESFISMSEFNRYDVTSLVSSLFCRKRFNLFEVFSERSVPTHFLLVSIKSRVTRKVLKQVAFEWKQAEIFSLYWQIFYSLRKVFKDPLKTETTWEIGNFFAAQVEEWMQWPLTSLKGIKLNV